MVRTIEETARKGTHHFFDVGHVSDGPANVCVSVGVAVIEAVAVDA